MKLLFSFFVSLIAILFSATVYAQNDTIPKPHVPKDSTTKQTKKVPARINKEKPKTNIFKYDNAIRQIEGDISAFQQQQKATLDKVGNLEKKINRQLKHIDSLQSFEKGKINNIEKKLELLDTLSKRTEKVEVGAKRIFSFHKLWIAIIITLITLFVVFITSKILRILADRSLDNSDRYLRSIPFAKLLLFIFALTIIVLWVFPPPLEVAMIITAAIAIALGLGAQPNLKNMFGGLTILLKAPFKTGDNIQIGDHIGVIQEIGLSNTSILSPNDTIIHIPNSQIISKAVLNTNNGNTYSQVIATIYLPNNIDIKRAKTIAKETAQTSRYIYLNKPIIIWFENEIGTEPYLKMSLKAYVIDITFENDFKSDMTEILLTELYNHNLI